MKKEYLDKLTDQVSVQTETYTQIQAFLDEIHDNFMEPYSDGTEDLHDVVEQLEDFYKYAFYWFVKKLLSGQLTAVRPQDVITAVIADWKKASEY